MSLGIALIGAGSIARDHLAAFQQLAGAEVVHVIGRNPEKARALATQAGGVAWSTDPAAAFADPAVAAVDICTPPDTHAALAIAAAEQGKAIHLETPAALSLAEFDAMTAAAETAQVPLMIGQTLRFQPVHQELAAAIAAGEVGRVRLVHFSRYAGYVWPGSWEAWQLDPARSGGQLVHNGVHAIDLATWLLGSEPVRVFARGFQTFAPNMPTPDSFHVMLRFADGGLALVAWSSALRRRGDLLTRIVAVGEKGSIHHTSEGEPDLASDAARLPSPTVDGAIVSQLRHWLAVVRGEAEPIVRNEQVRAVLAAALAAQRSLESGRAVEVSEVTHG